MENIPQRPLRRFNRQPDSWKSIFVIAIFAVVITAIFDRPSPLKGAREDSWPDTFEDVAVMKKVKRSGSATFRGGEATTVMGGADIDLRDAVMVGNQATLEVSTVMGGTRVRVPESWTVVLNVETVFSEVENRTHRPSHDNHRLILKGSVVMGDLKVTN